ncbi:unnamed protein product (macronuclear) [Paramecium tetraurelia]|uniref:PH domain-containing protein n=1 Tax=Paramecium tetraurelia TaxID=5888 RepID=A0C4X7_PARTE|nr:uncharacterized protein GSPATT00006343001 [Paramecium tetraurelia]CAK65844.1 unnamed protein product [Paramecium tetraurelia]|eukprot:XP_001433241.1 hypothetical protein (macronuclear) [Paramecium tetraurelia strain d4-2]
MNNQFQSHQGKQQFKIKSYLQGRVLKAKKLNNSFLFHNQRSIALLKTGMLVYYSKCVKSPQENADLMKSKPKYGVYFNNALYSCVKISNQEVELIVKFKKSQLYKFDDNLINYVEEPRSQDIVLWIFVIQMDQLLSKNNCDINKGRDSLNSLQNFQGFCFDERTQKSNYYQAKTEKTSIEQRINTNDVKIKKRVQWLDNFTQQQIVEQNSQNFILEQNIQNTQQKQQEDEWEINQENTDLSVKSIQIRMGSFSLNGSSKNNKLE